MPADPSFGATTGNCRPVCKRENKLCEQNLNAKEHWLASKGGISTWQECEAECKKNSECTTYVHVSTRQACSLGKNVNCEFIPADPSFGATTGSCRDAR